MNESVQITGRANIRGLVPKESIEREPPPRIHLPWGDYLQSLCQRVDQADKPAHFERHQKWLRNLRHWEGRMLGFLDERSGRWQDVSREPGDPLYVFNFIQYYVNTIIKEASRSRAQFNVLAVSERMEHEMGARAYRVAIEEIQRNRWTASEAQRAAKFWVLTGNRFVRSGVVQSRRFHERRPRYETRPVEVSGAAFYCTDCGLMGDSQELEPAVSATGTEVRRCPQCGSPQVVERGAVTVEQQVIAGFDMAPGTEIDAEVIDPFQVKLNLQAHNLKHSSFLRNLTLVRTGLLQSLYDWADIGHSHTLDQGMLARQELQRSAGNTSITAQGQQVSSGFAQEVTEFAEYWLEPAEYAEYRFPLDTELASGEVIPKDTSLLSLRPTGMKIVRAGGLIVEEYEEAKNDLWTQACWELAPDNAYGLGIENIIVANEIHNRVMSLLFEATMKEVSPRRIYNQLKVGKTAFTARPGWASPMRNPTPTDNPGNYIHVDQAQPVSQGGMMLAEGMKADMGLLAGGVFSQLSGDPSIRSDTLGGMAIMREQALSNLLTRLELIVEADTDMVRQHCQMLKAYRLWEPYLRRASAYAEYELQMAEELEPLADLKVSVVEGSWVPRSELERRNDLADAFALGGLPGGVWNPAVPELVRKLALERLNLPYDTDQTNAGERQQRMELHTLFLLGVACQEKGVPPEIALLLGRQKAPVNFLFHDHATHLRHIEEWANTDLGMEALRHPIASLLIVDHLRAHVQGPVLKQQMIAQAQAETLIATTTPEQVMVSEGATQPQPAAENGSSGASRPQSPATPSQSREPGNPTVPRPAVPRA